MTWSAPGDAGTSSVCLDVVEAPSLILLDSVCCAGCFGIIMGKCNPTDASVKSVFV